MRLANGDTVVAAGYAASLQIFDPRGALKQKITGPAEVRPFFYCGLQQRADGHFLVTNWQGHGIDHGAKGTQVLLYHPSGKLLASWRQDPSVFSSLQAAVALDA